jgi:hypothetical protein
VAKYVVVFLKWVPIAVTKYVTITVKFGDRPFAAVGGL